MRRVHSIITGEQSAKLIRSRGSVSAFALTSSYVCPTMSMGRSQSNSVAQLRKSHGTMKTSRRVAEGGKRWRSPEEELCTAEMPEAQSGGMPSRKMAGISAASASAREQSGDAVSQPRQ